MIGSTLIKTLRAFIAILLMELARVANLKPKVCRSNQEKGEKLNI